MTSPYHDGTYAEAHPDWHAEDASCKAEVVATVVERMGWRPQRVVDVGCGTGDVLVALARRWEGSARASARLEGWDIAPHAISRARDAHPRVQLYVGDAFAAAPAADLALCLDVAEHVPDDVAFLARLARLAPRAVVRLPLDLSVLDLLRPHRLLEARHRYGHLHLYTRALALDRLSQAELEVQLHLLHRVPPPRDTPRRQAVDAVRRAMFAAAPELTVDLLGGWSLVAAATTR